MGSDSVSSEATCGGEGKALTTETLNECLQDKDIDEIKVDPTKPVRFGVDPEIADHGWTILLNGQPLKVDPTKKTYQSIPGSVPFNAQYGALGDSTLVSIKEGEDEATGLWSFRLKKDEVDHVPHAFSWAAAVPAERDAVAEAFPRDRYGNAPSARRRRAPHRRRARPIAAASARPPRRRVHGRRAHRRRPRRLGPTHSSSARRSAAASPRRTPRLPRRRRRDPAADLGAETAEGFPARRSPRSARPSPTTRRPVRRRGGRRPRPAPAPAVLGRVHRDRRPPPAPTPPRRPPCALAERMARRLGVAEAAGRRARGPSIVLEIRAVSNPVGPTA